jgi:hypothetical protein
MPLTNAEAAEFEMKAAGEDARGEWKDGSFARIQLHSAWLA